VWFFKRNSVFVINTPVFASENRHIANDTRNINKRIREKESTRLLGRIALLITQCCHTTVLCVQETGSVILVLTYKVLETFGNLGVPCSLN